MSVGHIAASPAITTTASAIPERIIIAAVVTASPPEEHAVLTVIDGPVIPWFIENWAAAMLPIALVRNFGPA